MVSVFFVHFPYSQSTAPRPLLKIEGTLRELQKTLPVLRFRALPNALRRLGVCLGPRSCDTRPPPTVQNLPAHDLKIAGDPSRPEVLRLLAQPPSQNINPPAGQAWLKIGGDPRRQRSRMPRCRAPGLDLTKIGGRKRTLDLEGSGVR